MGNRCGLCAWRTWKTQLPSQRVGLIGHSLRNTRAEAGVTTCYDLPNPLHTARIPQFNKIGQQEARTEHNAMWAATPPMPFYELSRTPKQMTCRSYQKMDHALTQVQ